jgi:mono/diheme cytochrome c family protein
MNEQPKSNLPQTPEGEPTATRSTLPMWILAVTLMLLYLGAVYFDHHGGWFDAKVYTPYDSAEQLEAYQPKSGAAAMMSRGKQVYEQVCGLCHGNDGLGKPGQAPPLAGSEFVMAKDFKRLTHIPLLGVSGQITVKGRQYNMNMAAMGAALSDSDLADVLTYIRASWGNGMGAITPDEVKSVRASLGAHPQPMSGGQLMNMPE